VSTKDTNADGRAPFSPLPWDQASTCSGASNSRFQSSSPGTSKSTSVSMESLTASLENLELLSPHVPGECDTPLMEKRKRRVTFEFEHASDICRKELA
jgi:hypothetical protein